MQQISIAQATEGMILAKDVVTTDNRVLCGKATALSASIIERFKRMDITHVTVEDYPVAEKGAKSLKDELLAVEERFGSVRHIKPLMYLKKRIQKRLAAARQTTPPSSDRGEAT